MAKQSKIEYVDSTVNPTRGCGGCELWKPDRGGPCYAAAIHTRFQGQKGYPLPFGQVETVPGRMAEAAGWSDLKGTARPGKPWMDGRPRVIFVGDMTDVFSPGVAFPYIAEEILHHVESTAGSRHRWMIFTKRPVRLVQFVRWYADRYFRELPGNLLPVISATDQQTANVRLDALAKAGVLIPRFGISLEPLFGPVDVQAACERAGRPEWVALGGQSGNRRPVALDIEWARQVRNACHNHGIPFFFKQWGHGRPGNELDGRHHTALPF